MDNNKPASIEPWLSVDNGEQAVAFYKLAFNAIETYRLETPDGGLVVKLGIGTASIWVSSEASSNTKKSNPLGGNTIRMILIVDDPYTLFTQAIGAGATQLFPVSEEHGWCLGRLSDPFGLHWEIGYLLPAL